MRIGLIMQNYRKNTAMSMDAFAKKCNLSKAYISMLEQGLHPKTKKPIQPSVDTIKKIAIGMGMDFEDLFKMLDEDITVSDKFDYQVDYLMKIDDPVKGELEALIETATPKQKSQILAIAKAFLQQE